MVPIIAGDFGQRVIDRRNDYPVDDCLDYCADEHPVSKLTSRSSSLNTLFDARMSNGSIDVFKSYLKKKKRTRKKTECCSRHEIGENVAFSAGTLSFRFDICAAKSSREFGPWRRNSTVTKLGKHVKCKTAVRRFKLEILIGNSSCRCYFVRGKRNDLSESDNNNKNPRVVNRRRRGRRTTISRKIMRT